mmetsp:Transcript_17131/g.50271  ORF Transcript_17131/g.50271 Transcript_17131/m.50271 type:complete len:364 (+) Transcript_17131:1047-2138(+)
MQGVEYSRVKAAAPASRRLLLQHAHRPQHRHAHRREVALEDEVCAAVPLVHLAARVEPRRAEVVQVDVERVVVRVLVVREEVLRPPDVRVVHKGQPAKGGRLVDPRRRAQRRVGRLVHGGREEQPLRKRERQRRGQRPRHPPGKAARPDGKGGCDPRPVLGRRLVLCRGAKVAAEQRLEVALERRLAHTRDLERRLAHSAHGALLPLLPRQPRGGSDRHRLRRRIRGRRQELHHSLARAHEPVHAGRPLGRHRHPLDGRQHRLAGRAEGEVRLGQAGEDVRGLARGEEVDRVKGVGHVEAVGPLQHVAASRVPVRPLGGVVPLAGDLEVHRLGGGGGGGRGRLHRTPLRRGRLRLRRLRLRRL